MLVCRSPPSHQFPLLPRTRTPAVTNRQAVGKIEALNTRGKGNLEFSTAVAVAFKQAVALLFQISADPGKYTS